MVWRGTGTAGKQSGQTRAFAPHYLCTVISGESPPHAQSANGIYQNSTYRPIHLSHFPFSAKAVGKDIKNPLPLGRGFYMLLNII